MTHIRPLCYSFHPSLLSFGAFIRPCFIPSFIHHTLSRLPSVVHTCLSSIVLSFSHVDHALGCSLHPSSRPSFVRSSPSSTRSLHRSSVIRPIIDRSRSWCSGGAADPCGVDYRDAALSLPPFIILHRRLLAFCCRPFVLLSLRSVHPSSGPEPIRCIHPSLSRSVSHPHSVVSDSSLIVFSSVLSIIQYSLSSFQ